MSENILRGLLREQSDFVKDSPMGRNFNFIVNGVERPVRTREELVRVWPDIRKRTFSEISLKNPEGPMLIALVNRDRAMLVYMREEGDVGFRSRSRNRDSVPNALMEFYLSNGQRDEFPVEWCVSTHEAIKALEAFLLSAEKPKNIQWHDDSDAN